MSTPANTANERKLTNVFERYLTVWVALCIVGGTILGKAAPGGGPGTWTGWRSR